MNPGARSPASKQAAASLAAVMLFSASAASAATLFLERGEFYGPGDAGMQPFPDAQVRNVVLTGPLQGYVPFFNNGAAEPNVTAETLNVGHPVDGRTSDGTVINENLDTALVFRFTDPHSGETATIMGIAEAGDGPGGAEPIRPDEKGNITFTTKVVADPGDASHVRRFTAVFTSGAVTIPKSLSSQSGMHGGQDYAGPLPSGRTIIGNLGDSNRDGLLDGVLVLAATPPIDLVVVRGNPIAQRRPFSTDIPIPPAQAALLTLNGIVANFPEPIGRSLMTGEFEVLLGYLASINERLNSALGNLRDSVRIAEGNSRSPEMARMINSVMGNLQESRHGYQHAVAEIEKLMQSDDEARGRRDHEARRHKAERDKLERKLAAAFALTSTALAELHALVGQRP